MRAATVVLDEACARYRNPRASVPVQVLVLSRRSISASFRGGDYYFAVVGPVIFFTCLYVPLHYLLNSHNSLNYAQYLLPAIAVQGMFFSAMSAGDLAATDGSSKMIDRFRSMPLQRWSPLAGRLMCGVVGCASVIVGSTAIGYAYGFRFNGGVGDIALYIALLMAFGIALCVGADALCSRSSNPEVGGQLLLIPQLLLIMVSTGVSPAENFPSWIRPFVRNQPVSPVVEALRDSASGAGYSHLAVATSWCMGLVIALGALAVVGEKRAR